MKRFCDGTKVDLPLNEHEKWVNKGWLGQDGICEFPRDVSATLNGVELVGLPGNFWYDASDDEVEEALKKGWIRFISGNGEHLTKDAYIKKYPEYPAPDFAARFLHIMPPEKNHFVTVGKRR
jgi:hypothetical protein